MRLPVDPYDFEKKLVRLLIYVTLFCIGLTISLNILAAPVTDSRRCFEVFQTKYTKQDREYTAYVFGEEAAWIRYRVTKDFGVYVYQMQTEKRFRGGGIMRGLTMFAMEPVLGEVEQVSAILIDDNYDAAKLGNETDFSKCADAIANTPFFKIFSVMGFETVFQCEHEVDFKFIRVGLGK